MNRTRLLIIRCIVLLASRSDLHLLPRLEPGTGEAITNTWVRLRTTETEGSKCASKEPTVLRISDIRLELRFPANYSVSGQDGTSPVALRYYDQPPTASAGSTRMNWMPSAAGWRCRTAISADQTRFLRRLFRSEQAPVGGSAGPELPACGRDGETYHRMPTVCPARRLGAVPMAVR